MTIKDVFDNAIGTLISEMARGDLKGAGDALMNKDWTKAAEKYVENAKERGLEDSKIVSGLGSTFRSKAGEETVTVGKTEDGEPITLTKDDIAAMKKAVKEYMGWEPKPKKKSSKKKKEEEGEEKPKTELKKKSKKDDDEEVDIDINLENTKSKKDALKEEILKICKY